MNTKKLIAITLGVILLAGLIYGLFLGSSGLLASHYIGDVEDSQSEIEDQTENLAQQTFLSITVVSIEETFNLRVRNNGNEQVNLEDIEFLANGETIDNPEFEDQHLASEEQTTVETGIEATENTTFTIQEDGAEITSYNCEYNEEAFTC